MMFEDLSQSHNFFLSRRSKSTSNALKFNTWAFIVKLDTSLIRYFEKKIFHKRFRKRQFWQKRQILTSLGRNTFSSESLRIILKDGSGGGRCAHLCHQMWRIDRKISQDFFQSFNNAPNVLLKYNLHLCWDNFWHIFGITKEQKKNCPKQIKIREFSKPCCQFIFRLVWKQF